MKTLKKCLLFAIAMLVLSACNPESDKIGPSQIDTKPPVLNDLDIWLRENFVKPYNIDISYKWDINESSIYRYLRPPFIKNVKPLAEALLKVWVEPYTKVGGKDFIKTITPRQFTFVGSANYDPNSPTVVLGIAEAGTKITLFNLDDIDYKDLYSIIQPIKVVHHEYGHILNQTKPFDRSYGKINPENYTGQWFNRTDSYARELGYITAYASNNEKEDFVEMISEMLINSKDEWDALVNRIYSEDAKAIIRKKEAMVADYFLVNFKIDIYELQKLTSKALDDLVK